MTEKERVVDAIMWHINYRLNGNGEMYVINGNIGLVGISHKDNSDISFLAKLGIKIPPYYDEKHWERGVSNFSFFITNEIFRKVREDFAVNKHA